jgi:hypothetical protein
VDAAKIDTAVNKRDVKKRLPTNPFYLLLVVVGVAFSITACAYGTVTYRALRVGTSEVAAPIAWLVFFLDRFGAQLLAGELVLLSLATVGAIGTDGYWTRRADRREKRATDTAGDESSRSSTSSNSST